VSKKGLFDRRPKRKEDTRRHFRSYVKDIGRVLLLIGLPIALDHWTRANPDVSLLRDQTSRQEEELQRQQEERREFRSYVWGAGSALVLTLVPFALVHWFPNISRLWLLIVIGAFALVQILVHFHFFLHIGFKQKREDLQLLLFSGLLLTIMVAGTIWIMASLALRMAMPVSF
jgi:cytochrome o ubiquinol oxidase operon protein cyoD